MRYLVFMYDLYTAIGGSADIKLVTDSLGEATDKAASRRHVDTWTTKEGYARSYMDTYDCSEVYDTHTNKVVFEG